MWRSAWPPAVCSAHPADQDNPTWRCSRARRSRRSGSWPAPDGPGASCRSNPVAREPATSARPSARSSVMSWAIAPRSGPTWENEPMNQVSRNIGREPRPHTVHDQWLDHALPVGHLVSSRRGSGWGTAVRLLSTALLTCGLTGCQNFSVPFAQWTAGYDPSLSKKISKEEKDGTTSETVEE